MYHGSFKWKSASFPSDTETCTKTRADVMGTVLNDISSRIRLGTVENHAHYYARYFFIGLGNSLYQYERIVIYSKNAKRQKSF